MSVFFQPGMPALCALLCLSHLGRRPPPRVGVGVSCVYRLMCALSPALSDVAIHQECPPPPPSLPACVCGAFLPPLALACAPSPLRSDTATVCGVCGLSCTFDGDAALHGCSAGWLNLPAMLPHLVCAPGLSQGLCVCSCGIAVLVGCTSLWWLPAKEDTW